MKKHIEHRFGNPFVSGLMVTLGWFAAKFAIAAIVLVLGISLAVALALGIGFY